MAENEPTLRLFSFCADMASNYYYQMDIVHSVLILIGSCCGSNKEARDEGGRGGRGAMASVGYQPAGPRQSLGGGLRQRKPNAPTLPGMALHPKEQPYIRKGPIFIAL